MKSVGLIAVVVLAALPAWAQTPRPLNELTVELKRLEFLIGDWKAEGSVYHPEGEKESWTGTTRGRWALRGRHLKLDSAVTTKAGTTESSAMFTWDPNRERYHAILFSSTEPTPRFVAGTLEGDKLTLHGPRGDSETRIEMVFEKVSEEGYSLSVQTVGEETATKLVDGKYERRKT